MLERLDQIIVAVSSSPGRGAVGIVRLSGPGCLALVDKMFRAGSDASKRSAPPTRGGATCNIRSSPPTRGGATLGEILLGSVGGNWRIDGEVVIDDGLRLPGAVYLFRGPHSYTRQDMAEIMTVGSPAAMELVRSRTIALGALPAQAGEFTARAFLLGAMDLGKAESVAAIIRAQSDTQLRAARRMMDGALHTRITEIRDELAELLALVEADIDFAEEPIEFITPTELRTRLSRIAGDLSTIAESSVTQEQLDGLPRILLFGAPNAGKSTLMNRLSGVPRAICAAVAGTTRDLLSAPISLGRGEGVLLDAAGVDESMDPIIASARSMTLAAAERVDLLCWVVDATSEDESLLSVVQSFSQRKFVIALNKSDAVGAETLAQQIDRAKDWNLGPVVSLSALKNHGVEELREQFRLALADALATSQSESVALTLRQLSAIGDALGALRRAEQMASHAGETVDCADVTAFELREALDVLGTVTGAVSTDDLLGRVFQQFCIGK